MILWDVNLWVYAFRSESPLHATARAELDAGSSTGAAYVFSPLVAASFLRLVTNRRIFVNPSPLEEAWAFVDVLSQRSAAVRVDVDPVTWGIFKHLCLVAGAVGNDVPDAVLAAIAIRHDATLVTADRRLGRFAGLTCRFVGG